MQRRTSPFLDRYSSARIEWSIDGPRGTAVTTPADLEPIDARRGVVEELRFLRGREFSRQPLERVPQHRVAARHHVDGEVRLEHAAIGAELLDRELVVGARGVAELLARWRLRPLVPSEPVDLHVDPAELGDDVRAGGELGDRRAPLPEHVLFLGRVGADADRPTEVIEDDRGVGKRARQRGDLRDLPVIAPPFERETAWRQLRVSGAEVVAREQSWSRVG